MNNYKEIQLNWMSIPLKYIKASISHNLQYINDKVSHIEIDKIYDASSCMYAVTCKDAITGKKEFVVWAYQKKSNLEDAVQSAKDELKNQILLETLLGTK